MMSPLSPVPPTLLSFFLGLVIGYACVCLLPFFASQSHPSSYVPFGHEPTGAYFVPLFLTSRGFA
jgi:hypothetical protein